MTRYKRYHPKRRSTTKSLLKFIFAVSTIVVILAFIGVEPLAGYKNAIVDNWDSIVDNAKSNLAAPAQVNTKTASLNKQYPFDIALDRVYSMNNKLVVILKVSPNKTTKLDDAYIVRWVDTEGNTLQGGKWLVRLASTETGKELVMQLPDDVAEKLVLATDIGRKITSAIAERDSARNRRAKLKEQEEEIAYNFVWRGEVPDYNSAKRMGQELRDADNVLAAAERKITELETEYSNIQNIAGISIQDIVKYLDIRLIGDERR